MSLVLVFALGVSAISAQGDIESVDPTGQTITYWHQYQPESAQGTTIAAIVEQFNSTNEWGITVDASYQGSYGPIGELINAGIVSGELPNLVAGYANAAASYMRDNAAVDLAPYINSEKWGMGADPDINQALIDVNTSADGVILAWPNQSSAQVIAYNQTLLSFLGYDAPPTTVEAFKEVACAAANATGPNGEDLQGFPITTDGSAFESWVAGMGGSIYHDGAFDYQNDAVLATLQMYHDLYADGCAYVPAERFAEQTDFNNGIVPFYVTSTAGFTFILSGFQDTGVEADWNIMTFPHNEGSESLNVFVPSIVMMAGAPEAQLASWLFLKYLATPEVATQWSEGSGYFNPVPSTAAALDASTNFSEGLAPYFNAGNALLNNPDIAKYSNPPIAAYDTMRGVESTAIADVTSNGMDPADVAATLQEAADQAVADSM
ncbi:MAG: extracellular solute-binding protein [Anaerolineae bacterium]